MKQNSHVLRWYFLYQQNMLNMNFFYANWYMIKYTNLLFAPVTKLYNNNFNKLSFNKWGLSCAKLSQVGLIWLELIILFKSDNPSLINFILINEILINFIMVDQFHFGQFKNFTFIMIDFIFIYFILSNCFLINLILITLILINFI